MSDYISKSALKKYLRDYKWEFALGSDFSKAMEMVDVQPTVDEKEIIRKTFMVAIDKLCDLLPFLTADGQYVSLYEVVQILKEECGINE